MMTTEPVFRIERDGFEGTIIGTYETREGEKGVVLQQVGTKVVHVYREKWLIPVKGATMPDDFKYQPIEPAECPHCPGIKHWPQDCPTPKGRAQALKEISEIMEGVARVIPNILIDRDGNDIYDPKEIGL